MKHPSKSVLIKIPSQTKWLLEFANLGRKPGKINPSAPCGLILIESLRRKIDITKPDFSKLDWRPKRGNGIKSAIDENKNVWIRFPGSDPIWALEYVPFPLQEFWKLVSAKGWPHHSHVSAIGQPPLLPWEDAIVEIQNIEEAEVEILWRMARSSLLEIMKGQPIDVLEDLLGDERYQFPTVIEFYNSVVQFLRDFYRNQEMLHSLLRVCSLCGRFWIEEGKTKPKMFCSENCTGRFYQFSKQDDIERQKGKRMKNMIKKLVQKGYTREEAKKQVEIKYQKKIKKIANEIRPIDIN